LRVVLDSNVLISALLSPGGAPAKLVLASVSGELELVVSPLLLDEVRRALGYPKLRQRITAAEADAFVGWLDRAAYVAEDPAGQPPVNSEDPGDDYLIALAADTAALLVSGDHHLTDLTGQIPVLTPAGLISRIES
jgi:putative PIN family toxin of toxin-antitoxin system